MEMLIQKRQELNNQLQTILAEREKRHIEALTTLKDQLAAEPLPKEVEEIKKVIAAIDEVLNYETNKIVTEAPVAEEVKEIVKVEEVPVEEIPAEAKIVEAVEIKEETPVTEEVKEEVPTELAPEVKETEQKTVTVTIQTTPEVAEMINARPGMAYVGIPERR